MDLSALTCWHYYNSERASNAPLPLIKLGPTPLPLKGHCHFTFSLFKFLTRLFCNNH